MQRQETEDDGEAIGANWFRGLLSAWIYLRDAKKPKKTETVQYKPRR